MSELSSITLVSSEGENYEFENVQLEFLENQIQNKFTEKNDRTLRDILEKSHYRELKNKRQFSAYQLGSPIGKFLEQLKSESDPFYSSFLNAYGDLTYCTFRITQEDRLTQKGLYIYTVDSQIKYIGRCKDSFKKRINQGYGKIHPTNCYKHGQSTNCHLNSLIAENPENVAFYVHTLTNDEVIKNTERELIQEYKLKQEELWNIQLNLRRSRKK